MKLILNIYDHGVVMHVNFSGVLSVIAELLPVRLNGAFF